MSREEPLPPRHGEGVGVRRERAARIMVGLHDEYPGATCALVHDTPFQLLVATILSAQCTDARVNEVTPALFAAYPSAASMSQAEIDHLEQLVRPTGFYRQKAKNIRAAAQRIIDMYDGEVPRTVAELTTLAGAARKTANVVISNCFPEGAEGIAVDTHVQRIARRLGLVREYDPVKLERELMKVLAQEEWNHVTHLMIDHGRAICKAPIPMCDICPEPIAGNCPSRGRWN